MNPFMKTIDGIIAYAPNPRTSNYIQRNGMAKKVDRSYNSLLAAALDESLSTVLEEMKSVEVGSVEGVKCLEELMEQNPRKVIVKMKKYLTECQENNPDLEIKGIKKESAEIQR